jgi:hypothetical protein
VRGANRLGKRYFAPGGTNVFAESDQVGQVRAACIADQPCFRNVPKDLLQPASVIV